VTGVRSTRTGPSCSVAPAPPRLYPDGLPRGTGSFDGQLQHAATPFMALHSSYVSSMEVVPGDHIDHGELERIR
jgi:hypothetical protein